MEKLVDKYNWKKEKCISDNNFLYLKNKKKHFLAILVLLAVLIFLYIFIPIKTDYKIGGIIGAITMAIGIIIGFIISIGTLLWYNKYLLLKGRKDTAKSYGKLIKADIDRTEKQFKNKKISLAKLNEISIIDNWLMVLSNLGDELSELELGQYISYYSQIDNIVPLKAEYNNHFRLMESIALKEYGHIREFNSCASILTLEIKKLFLIDITDLTVKLEKLYFE